MQEEKQGTRRTTPWGFSYNIISFGDSDVKPTPESRLSASFVKRSKEKDRLSAPLKDDSYFQRLNDKLDQELRQSEQKRTSLPQPKLEEMATHLDGFFSKHLAEDPNSTPLPIDKSGGLNIEGENKEALLFGPKPPSKPAMPKQSLDLMEEKGSRKSEAFFSKREPDRLPDAPSRPSGDQRAHMKASEVIVIDDEGASSTNPKPALAQKEPHSTSTNQASKESKQEALMRQHIDRFMALTKEKFIDKFHQSRNESLDIYLYNKLQAPSDLRKLYGKRIGIDRSHKIFHEILELELLNLKGQKLYQVDAFTLALKAAEAFVKEVVDQLVDEAIDGMVEIVEQPNIKNSYLAQKNDLIAGLISTFQGILASLEEMSAGRKSAYSQCKEELVKMIHSLKKGGKYLIYQKELSEDLNNKNIAFVEKNLKTFFDAARMLESGFNDLHDIFANLERADRSNDYNYQKLYREYYRPLEDTFEASSLDLAKDWLRLSE